MEVNLEGQSSDAFAKERKWSVLSCAGNEAELESARPDIYIIHLKMIQ